MWLQTVTTLVLLTSTTTWAQCEPGDNCKAPDCRCWNDPKPPGGLEPEDIPQMVLVSFGYAVTEANVDLYRDLFDGITNPNGCQPKGTFFLQDEGTDFAVVNELYVQGHEMAVMPDTGDTPEPPIDWDTAYSKVIAAIIGAGVPESDIQGSRGRGLFSGSNAQFDALRENGLSYDSTCVSQQYNLLWPYTYDFVDSTPTCTIGSPPTKSYPGTWQFPVASLEFNGQKCASPSGCSPLIHSQQDAFDLLYDSFSKHYRSTTTGAGARAPFILDIDPVWLTVAHQNAGTRQFLEFIRAALSDTWILTTQQALAWIRDPVPTANINSFQPWRCR